MKKERKRFKRKNVENIDKRSGKIGILKNFKIIKLYSEMV